MAKPIAFNRNVPPLQRIPAQVPELVPQDLEYFHPPKGLDTLTPITRMSRSYSPAVVNLILRKGILQSRNAFSQYGSKPSAPAEATILAADVELPTALAGLQRRALRWTKTKLYIYQAGNWVATPAVHNITDFDGVDFVTWNSTIVYSAGTAAAVPGILEYSPPTIPDPQGTYRILTGSPTAEHVTLFGNRIVASAISGLFTSVGNRIQWTVKNDDNDWAGIGSGFEDLVVMTRDTADVVMGVYPISDTTALVVRESSIWRMDLTGFADAPFTFSLLTDQLGTTARRTIRAITGGVIFLGYDDVYIVTLGGIQRIGLPGLASVFTSLGFTMLGSDSGGVPSTLATSWGFYDRYNRRYWLSIPNVGVYIYSFDDQGWTQISLSFIPTAIAQTYYQSVDSEFHGVYLVRNGATPTFTLQEDSTATVDDDLIDAGPGSDFGIEVWSGIVRVDDSGGRRTADQAVDGSPLYKTQIIEAVLEYEAGASQALDIQFLRNGSWTTLGQVSVATTTGPSFAAVRRNVSGQDFQVRIVSSTLGRIKIHSLHMYVVKGAKIFA